MSPKLPMIESITDMIPALNIKSLQLINKYLSEIKTESTNVQSSKKEAISNLNRAYKDEELVLVLGAGVSVPYNLPSWGNLLQKLLLETFTITDTNTDAPLVLSKLFPLLFPNSPLISARFLEEDFKKKDKGKTFEEMVKEALYAQINREADSPTIKEILQFCIAPGRSPNLDSIITYNYDDILEGALLNSNVEIPFKSIYREGMNPKNGQLPIYHVHGYLPEEQEIDKGYKITLSENLYHKQYNDIYSWNNMVQINKFKDNVCIFIGISLTDPNIRRLLDIAMLQKGDNPKYHYLFKKRYKFKDVERNLEELLSQNAPLLDEKNKANLELDETAKHLLKKMEEFEELDAASFGIKIIWISDYDEIADVLKQIRTS
ncbi:SIR2-like domain-containing protein [Bacillus sp. OV166]|uniref:SIR2 family protein n=1 Tax=Bacillus sp. OV166 TaxID=1882763 RepID=UPI000A2AE8B1|nr:SIR2 family protein [Bacillus sp. OV166]SMQ78389.1 SIR2-like domain-containing protein [Bacillus sp. OV166]